MHFIRLLANKSRSLETSILYLPTVVVLFIGMWSRFILLFVDNYGVAYDEYAQMMKVHLPFWDYVLKSDAMLPHTSVYWIMYRILGNHMIAYMIWPTIFTSASFLLAVWLTHKIWPSPWSTFATSIFLLYNNFSIWSGQYTLVTYSASLVITTILIGYFLLQKKSFNSRFILLLTISAPVIGFFTNLFMALPILAILSSYLLVFYFKPKHLQLRKNFKSLGRLIAPVLIILAVPFIVDSIKPFINLGEGKRPDMDGYFFPTSEYSDSLTNVGTFVWTRSTKQLSDVFSPFPWWLTAGAIFFSWMTLQKLRKDTSLQFLLSVLVFMYFGNVFGAIVGKYPLGTGRYTLYWSVILAICLGGVAFHLGIFSQNKLKKVSNTKLTRKGIILLVFFTSATLLGLGIRTNVRRFAQVQRIKNQSAHAFETIQNEPIDLYLYTDSLIPILTIRHPQLLAKGKSMGWGTFWNYGKTSSIPEQLESDFLDSQATTIAIMSWSSEGLESFPEWMDFFDDNYTTVKTINSPTLYAKVGVKEE